MGSQSKVLIVDDDPDFVEATKAILESKPFKVIVAYDGKEGLAKARSENPNVIVLDVMMPGRDGWQVLYDLKKNPSMGLACWMMFFTPDHRIIHLYLFTIR